MAVVVLPYPYTDGAALNPALHNSNIVSTTAGQGLMSEPNGGLDPTNLAGGFTARPDHLWPGEVIRMTMESRLDSIDYMSDAFADSASSDADEAYTALPGAACRFFLPWQASAVLWQWTVFAHCFRFRNGVAAVGSIPSIRIRAFVDGSTVAHTRRTLPTTAFIGNLGGAFYIYMNGRESRSARSWDMAHLSRNLAAGWHELAVHAYMDIVDSEVTFIRTVGDLTGNWTHQMYHRMTVGISNARALCLL